MKRTFDNILFDEYGQSLPLATDDFIEYLLQNLNELRCERDELKKQLDDIRLVLTTERAGDII